MIGGVVIRERSSTTPAISRALKRMMGKGHVSKLDIERALANIIEVEADYESLAKESIERITQEKVQSILSSKDVKAAISAHVDNYLMSMHDVKQFISTVMQNINCIVQKYNKSTDEDNINAANHDEKAIFYSCKMINAKIQTILYVKNPNSIREIDFSYTEVHKLISKILNIYQSSFADKGISPKISECYSKIFTHYNAVSIIPHAIIDNALKYSPDDSIFHIDFEEDEADIIIRFKSFGPKILSSERNLLFNSAFRGKNAQKITSVGMGFGLYAASLIAKRLGGKIIVKQDQDASINFPDYYLTSFYVYLPKPSMYI